MYRTEINITSHCYQAIAASRHDFIDGKLYSYRTLEKLIGVTHQGIRQRAIADNWPMADIYDENLHRTNFVDGSYLAELQAELKEQAV
ncbi:hypothetical protein OAG77_00310 [bacterium]|jgi:hypothetical protein|nr:hypothetical protein [bacterium]